MINKIKNYLEYRKNKKIAKREFIKIAANTLSIVRNMSDKGVDITKFIVKLTNEAKNVEGEKLIELVLNEISAVLQTNNNRIIEVLSYIASLEPTDIQKILVHSVVETMANDSKTE